MTKFHNMPPAMQVQLHEDGILTNPDFIRDHTGLIVRDVRKVKAYMAENDGQPPH